MTTHILKIWPCYFNAAKAGTKTFEVRDNSDRGFQCGDNVILREYDMTMVDVPPIPPEISRQQQRGFTGQELAFKIGYVLPIEDDKVVFSLLPKDET